MRRPIFAATALALALNSPAAELPAGVTRPDLAWQHWALNCQGCHRTDGSGSPETAPAIRGMVARFTNVAGGREYLARVPGVATAPLADADLAELLNWILSTFDGSHLSPTFRPFTAEEISVLRRRPLRTEAAAERVRLLEKISGLRQ
jgi:mono/diheme cytochrome c family protein